MLDKMPIMDRKYYINKYIEYIEQRTSASQGGGVSTETSDITSFTDMSQGLVG